MDYILHSLFLHGWNMFSSLWKLYVCIVQLTKLLLCHKHVKLTKNDCFLKHHVKSVALFHPKDYRYFIPTAFYEKNEINVAKANLWCWFFIYKLTSDVIRAFWPQKPQSLLSVISLMVLMSSGTETLAAGSLMGEGTQMEEKTQVKLSCWPWWWGCYRHSDLLTSVLLWMGVRKLPSHSCPALSITLACFCHEQRTLLFLFYSWLFLQQQWLQQIYLE